ncbi:MAG TPA: hypothetical protein VIM37_01355 [Candidatus Microsaccharimonas sp.]|jgi:hypothetical protein
MTTTTAPKPGPAKTAATAPKTTSLEDFKSKRKLELEADLRKQNSRTARAEETIAQIAIEQLETVKELRSFDPDNALLTKLDEPDRVAVNITPVTETTTPATTEPATKKLPLLGNEKAEEVKVKVMLNWRAYLVGFLFICLAFIAWGMSSYTISHTAVLLPFMGVQFWIGLILFVFIAGIGFALGTTWNSKAKAKKSKSASSDASTA